MKKNFYNSKKGGGFPWLVRDDMTEGEGKVRGGRILQSTIRFGRSTTLLASEKGKLIPHLTTLTHTPYV